MIPNTGHDLYLYDKGPYHEVILCKFRLPVQEKQRSVAAMLLQRSREAYIENLNLLFSTKNFRFKGRLQFSPYFFMLIFNSAT